MASGLSDGGKARDGLRKSLLDSLDRLRSIAVEERLAYDRHGDTAKLLSAVLPAVRHVLTAAADLHGQCSFSGDSPLDDSGSLAESLDRLGLGAWFNEYGAISSDFTDGWGNGGLSMSSLISTSMSNGCCGRSGCSCGKAPKV